MQPADAFLRGQTVLLQKCQLASRCSVGFPPPPGTSACLGSTRGPGLPEASGSLFCTEALLFWAELGPSSGLTWKLVRNTDPQAPFRIRVLTRPLASGSHARHALWDRVQNGHGCVNVCG